MLENGAQVDKTDVKAQTPLFVAMVNQHWECAEALLEAGADPNGNEKNLCTPLAVMAQRGYYEGMCNRDRPRFFDQVGHQTTNASIENKHFFTK